MHNYIATDKSQSLELADDYNAIAVARQNMSPAKGREIIGSIVTNSVLKKRKELKSCNFIVEKKLKEVL